MKKFGIFAMIVIVIAATVGFSACKRKNEQTHDHNYAWVDNGDGTHKQHCSVDGCDEPDIKIGSHEYNEDGVCVCGARKPDEHEHAYVRKVAESKYLKSAATCQSKAVYYYSCECGEKGSETFEYGDLADHTGGTATCNKRAVCEVCGKEYGGVAEHSYVQKVTTERYLKSVATCQSKAVYHYSCVCGMTGTATFEYGELADHDYGELIYGYSADCENDGVKNHYRCSVCEKDFDENKQELSSLVIPAAHEFEGWEDEIAATCSKTGVRGHNHCNVCGKDFGADGNEIGSLIIKANGHNIENGKCTVCGMPEPTSGIEYVSYTDDPETYMVVGYDSTIEAKNVTSIVISDVINGYTVTKIRHDAFRYCSALTSVTIPASITCIDSNAFYGCSELASINYLGDLAEWNRIEGLEYLMTRGKSDKTVTIGGKEVAGDLVIPDGVGSVADYAFYKCGKLTSMVIPDSVKTIGKGAINSERDFRKTQQKNTK